MNWRFAIFGVLAFVAIASAAWIAISYDPRDALLSGKRTHDFGEVELVPGTPALRSHTFRLRNESGRTLVIHEIDSDCGCSVAKVTPMVVEPGGVLAIDVAMSFLQSGARQSQIQVNLDEDDRVVLVVRGVGFQKVSFAVSHKVVDLVTQSAARISAFATCRNDDVPPAPRIAAPDYVSAVFTGWRLVHARDRESARPARWEAEINLLASQPACNGAIVTIEDGPSQVTARVRVDGSYQ